MTNKEKWEQRNWFLFMIGYFAIGYVLINWFNENRTHYFDVVIPGERGIPFVPIFILGYLFVYISIAYLYALIDDIVLMHRAVVAYLLLTTLCYGIFIAFPVKMDIRPEVASMEMRGWIDYVVRAYFVVDRPYNALPSVHVSYPTMATFLVWRSRPIGRWVLLGMAVFTAISVVLVKQHFVMDVITGALAASLCYLLVTQTEGFWSRLFKKDARTKNNV